MNVSPTTASVDETVVFTFVFTNATGATVFDSLFENSLGLVFYGPERVVTCSSPSLGEIQLRTGVEIAPNDALTCSFPYTVRAGDVVNGRLDATVTLTVVSVGSTSATVSLPVS